MRTTNKTTSSNDDIRAQQNAAVLEYVESRGIKGAWFDGSTLNAPGDVPLRQITEDAGINWGGGGNTGKRAYSQVRVEKFIHPEERARHMLAECVVAVATTGKLPTNNIHKITINDDGDLVTTTGHVAMKRNAEIEKLLPLFDAEYAELHKEATGYEFTEATRFKTKTSHKP